MNAFIVILVGANGRSPYGRSPLRAGCKSPRKIGLSPTNQGKLFCNSDMLQTLLAWR